MSAAGRKRGATAAAAAAAGLLLAAGAMVDAAPAAAGADALRQPCVVVSGAGLGAVERALKRRGAAVVHPPVDVGAARGCALWSTDTVDSPHGEALLRGAGSDDAPPLDWSQRNFVDGVEWVGSKARLGQLANVLDWDFVPAQVDSLEALEAARARTRTGEAQGGSDAWVLKAPTHGSVRFWPSGEAAEGIRGGARGSAGELRPAVETANSNSERERAFAPDAPTLRAHFDSGGVAQRSIARHAVHIDGRAFDMGVYVLLQRGGGQAEHARVRASAYGEVLLRFATQRGENGTVGHEYVAAWDVPPLGALGAAHSARAALEALLSRDLACSAGDVVALWKGVEAAVTAVAGAVDVLGGHTDANTDAAKAPLRSFELLRLDFILATEGVRGDDGTSVSVGGCAGLRAMLTEVNAAPNLVGSSAPHEALFDGLLDEVLERVLAEGADVADTSGADAFARARVPDGSLPQHSQLATLPVTLRARAHELEGADGSLDDGVGDIDPTALRAWASSVADSDRSRGGDFAWGRHLTAEQKAVDCVVSAWDAWSACSGQCGNGATLGIRYRERRILISPRYRGSACPTLYQSGSCRLDCESPPSPSTPPPSPKPSPPSPSPPPPSPPPLRPPPPPNRQSIVHTQPPLSPQPVSESVAATDTDFGSQQPPTDCLALSAEGKDLCEVGDRCKYHKKAKACLNNCRRAKSKSACKSLSGSGAGECKYSGGKCQPSYKAFCATLTSKSECTARRKGGKKACKWKKSKSKKKKKKRRKTKSESKGGECKERS